ncbi:cyclic nucleotide-binding domain-containing protein [bacterium]
MTKTDILRHCRLFELLSDDELARVAEKCEEHYYRKGDYICREGAWGDSMYVIGSGEMKIIRKISVDTNWEITSMRHGDFFGEVALVDGSPRTASAVAVSNTVVLELYGRDFKMFINAGDRLSNRMLEALLHILINRLRTTDDIITRHMTEKLASESQDALNLRDVMIKVMVNQIKRAR